MKMMATGLTDREGLIHYIVAGGFLDLAAQLTDASGMPVEDWCEMLAQGWFALVRTPATFTKKTLTLTCANGPGPYTRAAGALRARSTLGNYYVNTGSVTIPNNGFVTAEFQAENPGPINDPSGTITVLSTPLSGVTVMDALAPYSQPTQSWIASTLHGTVTPTSSAVGSAQAPRMFKIQITQSGNQTGTPPFAQAAATLTVYGASSSPTITGPFSLPSTIDLSAYAAGVDLHLAFTDGTSAFSWTVGDVYWISTPGQATVVVGSEQETLASLVQRCRDRWPSLSAVPTESRYAGWIRQCSTDSQLGINRVSVNPNALVAGRIDIYVADGQGGPSSGVISALQGYLDLRAVDVESAIVASATPKLITVTGKVWCHSGQTSAVQTAGEVNWNNYLASVPIGGEECAQEVLDAGKSGIIRCSKLDQLLMDAGAYDVQGLQINAGGVDVDLQLTAEQVPSIAAGGVLNLTWSEVP